MKTGIIRLEEIESIPQEWVRTGRGGNRYIRVALEEHEPDKYGNTNALRIVLPQGVDRQNRSTYLCNFRPYVADDSNENYR